MVRWLLGAGACLIALLASLHLPFVRNIVFSGAASRLAAGTGVAATAARLGYNLLTLRFEADDLQLAVAGSPPLVRVESVRVDLGWSSLWGAVRLDEVALVRPRITIVAGDGGNLPPVTGGSSDGSPPRVDTRRLTLEDLELAWSDPSRGLIVEANGLDLHLAPSAPGTNTGALGLTGGASIGVGDRTLSVGRLEAQIAFDGNDLGIGRGVVETELGRLELSGVVRSLLARPELELDHRGDVDLEALAAFWTSGLETSGTVAFEGRLSGALASPEASLVLSGDPLRAGGLDDLAIARAEISASTRDLSVDALDLTIAGGRLEATGQLTLDGSLPGMLDVSWTDLDLTTVLASAGLALPGPPAGVATGTAQLTWPTLTPAAVAGTIENDIRPSLEPAPAAVAAQWHVALGDGRWSADLRHRVGDALRADATLGGTLADVPRDSTLSGSLEVEASAIDTASRALLGRDPGLTGELRATLDVGGTLGAPSAAGVIEGRGLVYGDLGPAALRGRIAGDRDRIVLDSLDAAIGMNTLQLNGQLDLQTADVDGILTMDLPTVADLARAVSLDWRPSGAVTVLGQLDGRWPAPRLAATLSGVDVGAAGLFVDRLDAEVRLAADGIAIERLVASQSGGRLEMAGRYDPATGGYALASAAEGLRLRSDGSPTRPDATVGWTLDGDGTVADPRGTAQLSLTDVRWRDRVLGRADVELNLAADALTIETTSAELGLDLDAAIDLAADTYELTADVAGLDPGRLFAAPADGATPLSGILSGTLSAAGVTSDPTAAVIRLDLRELDARLRGAPFHLEGPTTLRYSADQIAVEQLELAVGRTVVEVAGRISEAPADRLTATLSGDLGEAVSLIALVTGAPAPAPTLAGALQMRAAVGGPLAEPSIDADVELVDATATLAELPPVTDLDARVRYRNQTIILEDARAEWQGATAVGSGSLPVALLRDYLPETIVADVAAAGPARGTLRLESITPQTLTPFLDASTVERLAGRVDAVIAIEADQWTWEAARGELTLERADLSAADVPIAQRQPTRLRLADGRVEVVAWEWGAADNTVSLSGGATIADDPQLDLTATGRLDVGVLSALLQRAATSGEVTLDARLHGSARAPELSGAIQLNDTALRIADPPLTVMSLTGRLLLDGDRLRTDGLTGIANGGSLAVDGELGYAGWSVTDGSLSIAGRGLAMNVPDGLRSEVDADLTLSLSEDSTALDGSVTVLRGGFRDPLSLTTGLLAALRTPTVTARVEGEPSALDALTLDARLTTAEDILVANNYADLELGADVRLIGTLGQPALAGRVAIREGGEIFLSNNTYEIDSGVIDFTNPARIEPSLTLTARTRVSNHDITLNLNGTLDDFQSSLSSSPPAGEADIVSLLLTGRTLDEAGSAAGIVAREQALGLASADALGVAGRAVGLDTLRLDVTGGRDVRFDSSLVAAETDPGTRLTFGKNVSRDIQLVFSQSLKESGALTWIVNYAPRRDLELRGVVLDDNDRSYEFRHAVRFGDAPRTAAVGTDARVAAAELPRVSSVEFAGTMHFEDAVLRDQLDIAVGDRFEFYGWQRDQDRLERYYHDRGYREVRIRERRNEEEGAVRLVYEIDSGPIATLVIDGYDPPGDVRGALLDAWNRSVFDGFLLDELRAIVGRHLVAEGFLRAAVEAEVRSDAADAKTIAISIAPGPRSTSRRVVFSGHAGIDTGTLERQLTTSALTITAWLEPESAVDALTGLYRRSGWLAADVTVGPAEFDGETATLPIRIAEGPRFRISGVTIEGLGAREEADARDVLRLASGDLYTTAAVQTARLRLDASYRSVGFNAVRIDVSTLIDPAAGQAAVHVAVAEGPRQVLDSVAVTGLFRTHPGVVESALRLTPGEPLNLESWFQARRRLYDSGVFRSVNIETEPTDAARTPDEDELVRARVTVEEWPAYQLRYGVQLADQNAPLDEVSSRTLRPGLSADLTRSNLLGRAATAGISTRYTKVERAVRGFLSTPSMFGIPLTTSLFASLGREKLSGKDALLPSTADRSQITIEQRFRPSANLTVAYAYDFERNHTFNDVLVFDDPFNPIPFDPTVDVARLNTTGVWDSRDDLIAPTRGWFHSSSFEYAPEALGSDVRFVKYLAQQSFFRSVGPGVVLASGFRLGLAKGFGQALIDSERFLAGGGNSVRGYREDSLGPTDFVGQVVGGQALLIFNQEVRFPVAGRFGGVAFFDAGNTFERVRDLSISDLRMGVGFGLRVDTPFALLRADYGARLRRRSGEPTGRWFFSIGHAF